MQRLVIHTPKNQFERPADAPPKRNHNKSKRKEYEIATIDCETDPFEFDRAPQAFAVGLRRAHSYVEFWGVDCWRQMLQHLATIDVPLRIYAHNGGRFDFFYVVEELEDPIRLIGSRIVEARIGIHQLRDSWAIMPFPLAAYKKTEIDYAKFEKPVRESHKREILDYLHDDCNDLFDLVSAFVSRFGPRLTIAGTAMHALNEIHPQDRLGESHDAKFREFYFGGRVECFASGEVRAPLKVYDGNSAYPAAMKNADHPTGKKYVYVTSPNLDSEGWIQDFPGAMYFCEVTGVNLGALPSRAEDGSLSFAVEFGTFQTTSHELRAAIALGKFEVVEIAYARIPREVQRFDAFVTKYTDEKKAYKRSGNKIQELFSKYVVNSAYGKFGQNPAEFKDYTIRVKSRGDVKPDNTGAREWVAEHIAERWTLYSTPSPRLQYFDVAIAASVTSAQRAVLMRAIANAKNPIYCDTDSIICTSLSGVPLDEYELGAWKLEATGDSCSIAGKKLYVLWNKGKAVKYASKGTRLTPEAIRQVAAGEHIEWKSDAPNFSLTGKTKFVRRVSRKTA